MDSGIGGNAEDLMQATKEKKQINKEQLDVLNGCKNPQNDKTLLYAHYAEVFARIALAIRCKDLARIAMHFKLYDRMLHGIHAKDMLRRHMEQLNYKVIEQHHKGFIGWPITMRLQFLAVIEKTIWIESLVIKKPPHHADFLAGLAQKMHEYYNLLYNQRKSEFYN